MQHMKSHPAAAGAEKSKSASILQCLPIMVDLRGVSDSSIYELIQEDDFPSLRIGKRIVVPKEELRKWITAHTKGASEC